MFAVKGVPESKLGRYRLLAPKASVRVSPLCLGGMSIGEAWKEGMGTMDKKSSFELLDYFYNKGGNFIDTSNNYQNEESEKWIGEWMEEKKIRTEIVLATKWTTGYRVGQDGVTVNTGGNSIKNMHDSVAASLTKLRTDYIDVLYTHWWDYTMEVEELMQGLNVLVQQGKILYLGISDTPAWVVAKANQYARDHGLRQFSVYQGKWSPSSREFERDIIPMCISEGMALAPWGSIGGGNYKTEKQIQEMEAAGEKGRNFPGMGATEEDKAVSKVLEKVGKAHDLSITATSLAYIFQRGGPYVFPIVGGRKTSHLEDNIKALGVRLSYDEMKEIDSAYSFKLGFPHDTFGGRGSDHILLASVAFVDYPRHLEAIHYE